MKQQTAVEFAVEKLEQFIPSGNQLAILAILEQAKEMEKQNLILAHINGQSEYDENAYCDKNRDYAEQYYNDTFQINNYVH
jgi:hypothetical protein